MNAVDDGSWLTWFVPGPRAVREAGVLLAVALVLALALLLFEGSQLRPASPRQGADQNAITLAEAGSGPDLLWVDARPNAEYALGHIPGAVSCPMDADEPDLASVLALWRPEMLVVVYCSAGCDASQELAARLRQDLNSRRVRYLVGGWDAWRQGAR